MSYFGAFCIIYKIFYKINKKLLTKLDNGAIIVNCIIIAYYAQFADKQVFVSIILLYIIDALKKHRRIHVSENVVRTV